MTKPQAPPVGMFLRGRCVGIVKAAELLGVTERTVRRWAEAGDLPTAYRTKGGHRRFAEADLRAWLENHA